MIVFDHSRICCSVTIEWNGKFVIGSYTTINENTFIRCDENIYIGSYCDISRNCIITDSNFHNIELDPHLITSSKISSFPYFTVDSHKPITAPTIIDDFIWCGMYSWIFKGSHLSSHSIVAAGTHIFNKQYPEHSLITGNPSSLKKRLFANDD